MFRYYRISQAKLTKKKKKLAIVYMRTACSNATEMKCDSFLQGPFGRADFQHPKNESHRVLQSFVCLFAVRF